MISKISNNLKSGLKFDCNVIGRYLCEINTYQKAIIHLALLENNANIFHLILQYNTTLIDDDNT